MKPDPKFTCTVMADLYTVAKDEFGKDFVSERYYAVIEASGGRRWRHERSFDGCAKLVDSEGEPYFADIRSTAMLQATKLAANVERALAAREKIDPTRWREVEPAYGSLAHRERGMEFQRAMAERVEAQGEQSFRMK